MLSIHLKKILFNQIFNTGEYTGLPTEFHIGLSSTKPNELGENITEPNIDNTGYSRVVIPNTPEYFSVVNATEVSTNRDYIYFPESIKSWGEIKYVVIFDQDNKMLFALELTISQTVNPRTIFYLKPESLQWVAGMES